MLETEFHGQREYRTSVLVAHRIKEDQSIPNSRLLTGKHYWASFRLLDRLLINSLMKGSADGSLASLTIVEEEAFKRLGLLQGQLMRNIQHMAALNPKAFRWGFVPFDSIFILIQLA